MNSAGKTTTARTQGQFGWIAKPHQGPHTDDHLDTMGNGFNSSLPLSHIAQAAGACGTTGTFAPLGRQGFVALFGTVLWRCHSLKALADQEGNAAALAQAYTASGIECINLLGNDFSLVIVDPDNQKAFLATDRLARHPLYYFELHSSTIFGTNAASVLAHPDVPKSIDPQGIYNYVYFHMVPGPNSIYQNLKKLQAGTLLEIHRGQSTVKHYWLPTFEETSTAPFEHQAKELRQQLSQSVQRAIGQNSNVGAFLSGGLDSSTVAGMFSEQNHVQPRAFSIGFDAEGYDEMAYARITAKHFGVELNEYYVTPDDIVDALPLIATSYDEPFGNSSALPAWFCAKLARESGIDLLLAGDGGDELFAGNERYAKQKLFEIYGLLPLLIREKLIEPTTNTLAKSIPLAQKAQSYIQQAMIPLPDRLQSYNFLHRHAPSEIFNRDFLGQIHEDQPLDIQRGIYQAPDKASTLNRMLYLDWQFTLADNDLRKVSHMCALADIEVAYPMLDDELLNFSCRISSRRKLKGQNLRSFYKKSLTGWLPDETINKSKQGFGLPFGVWMQEHKPLQELAYDNLLSLKKRNYIDEQFLEKLIHLHKNGHAAYYGVLVWTLTVLELWLSNKTEK